ncbi:PREDICTED: endonuclease 8-like 1, partial [Mesitornis unicolor]|uniref:endonuclease 8-like 1 n=1 Tax=Mesitornis unicolor TaxID=54374 RepID=UPI000528CDC2
WQPDRGPCVLSEYQAFRENVLKNLDDKAFDRPICEALLNQKFFNGIGNYLRAEILFRVKIPPFEKARTVLEALKEQEETRKKKNPSLTLSKKLKLMRENPDLLELCHAVPMEVITAEKKLFEPEHAENYAAFKNWLQCYLVPGMSSLRDRNGRTIWFQGEPGPMAPKGQASRKKHARLKADPDALTPKVTTRTSKRRPRAAAKPSKPAEEKEVADRPRKGRCRGRRKATAASASSEPEAPVKAKRSCRTTARRGRGAAPAV